MLLRRNESGERDSISTIRDIVEIVAIVLAGIWAFYVFVYENRIKPSFAAPDVNVTASMERLSTQNDLTAVRLSVTLHNVGTVKARLLALAVNVYGQRVIAEKRRPYGSNLGIDYDNGNFFRLDAPEAVYTWAYLTHQGDASSQHGTELDPGSSIENDRIFYVPRGRFDLLTLGIDAPYTKYEETIPTSLVFQPNGGIKAVTANSLHMDQFNIKTVTSLDIR